MNIKIINQKHLRIINSIDIFDIMQKVLKRENKIDKEKEHFWCRRILRQDQHQKGTF